MAEDNINDNEFNPEGIPPQDNDKSSINPANFDLGNTDADIIQNVINDVQLQAEKNHALIEKRIFPQMPILGNPTLLYSIFRNMLDNALLYGGEGVVICITCFNSDAKQYYFTFTDNGPGVPEEHVAHLFERFYRVDSGRSRKMGGTGLGLAIVKHAVRFHGGNIAAENRPEGGLGFMFNLKKK